MIFRLKECMLGNVPRIRGPVHTMYKAAVKYGLRDKLKMCLELNNFGEISTWKLLIKRIVWKHESVKWKASCTMYSELYLYHDCVTEIKLHAWWSLVKARPEAFKQVSSVMALIQGSQPSGLQCNYGEGTCKLCHLSVKEDPVHVLFSCPRLAEVRQTHYDLVINEMPYALRQEVSNMGLLQKTSLLLAALKCAYVREWEPLYLRIASWI